MKFQKVAKDGDNRRMATPAEVRANYKKVMKLLDEWTIALLDGGKINGRGHGGNVEDGDFDHECGEKLIVISELDSLPTLVILSSDGPAGEMYPALMGVYKWVPAEKLCHLETCRNFPVYKHTDGSGLLYVDSAGNWVVGEDINTARMFSSKRPVLLSPPADEWQYFDSEAPEGQWKEDSNIDIAAGDVDD